tara:strand:+ start:19599 stop:20201 length:603 start_codon:yes stop_codon:yes gene_type:complete
MGAPVFSPASALPFPPAIVGRWYPTTSSQAVSSGVAAAENLVRLYAFQTRTIKFSELLVRVNTVGAGSFQLAIYANNAATGRPTGPALVRTGDMSSLALGAVTADIVGADYVLEAGTYWGATNVDAASAPAAFQTISANNAAATALFGVIDANAAVSAAGASLVTLTTPMAYNTWDSMTSATFTEVGGLTGAAHLWLKAA